MSMCLLAELPCTGIIGEWAFDKEKLAELANSFEHAHPYPYVVIDNFFTPEMANRIDQGFPVPNGSSTEWQQQVCSGRFLCGLIPGSSLCFWRHLCLFCYAVSVCRFDAVTWIAGVAHIRQPDRGQTRTR